MTARQDHGAGVLGPGALGVQVASERHYLYLCMQRLPVRDPLQEISGCGRAAADGVDTSHEVWRRDPKLCDVAVDILVVHEPDVVERVESMDHLGGGACDVA